MDDQITSMSRHVNAQLLDHANRFDNLQESTLEKLNHLKEALNDCVVTMDQRLDHHPRIPLLATTGCDQNKDEFLKIGESLVMLEA